MTRYEQNRAYLKDLSQLRYQARGAGVHLHKIPKKDFFFVGDQHGNCKILSLEDTRKLLKSIAAKAENILSNNSVSIV